MNCEEARAAFPELYDGALSGPPLVALSQHLDGCPECRREWEAFRGTVHALSDLGDEEPPLGFAARAAARIEAPSLWQRTLAALVLPLRVKVPIHAAALVLLAVAGVWLFQRSPELQRATDLRAPTVMERSASPPAPPAAVTPPEPARQAPSARADASTPAPKQKAEPSAPPALPKTVAPPAPAPAATPPAAGSQPAPPVVGQVEGSAPGRERGDVGQPSSARDEAAKPMTRQSAEGPRQAEVPMTAPGALRSAPAPLESRGKAESIAPPSSGVPAKEGTLSTMARKSANDLFSAAATDFAAQRYEGAVEALRMFLAQYPNDGRAPDARFLLADAYRAENRYAEASAEFETFLRQYPEHRMAIAALYRQGEMRLLTGDQSGCAILRDALNRYPDAREAASARETLAARCPQ